MNQNILNAAIEFVHGLFADEYSGHDWYHTYRVLRTAEKIAVQEGADLLTVQLSALLHDVDDRKLSPETCAEKLRARLFLESHGVCTGEINRIIKIIDEVSFLGTDSVVPSTIEGCCVQDADRLDAIGAIGIGRAFAYGGSHHRLMHDPQELPVDGMDAAAYCASCSTTINHFYEKLLLLPALMTTATGRNLADSRGKYINDFLEEFLAEWNGER